MKDIYYVCIVHIIRVIPGSLLVSAQRLQSIALQLYKWYAFNILAAGREFFSG